MDEEVLAKIQEAISEPPPEEEIPNEEVQPEAETEEVEAEKTDQEPEEPESEPEVETEEIQIDADVFASALGLTDDAVVVDDDGVKIKAKIDGQESAVTLQELLKGYQLEGHVTQKSQKLAEERRAFEQEREAQKQEMATALGQVKQLTDYTEQQLLAEFNIDWKSLRQNDPAEFSAKRQEFQERYAQIQQAKNSVVQQQQQLTEEQMAEVVQRERSRLLDAIPTWSNEEVAQTEREQVTQYLLSKGYAAQELASVIDHRAIAIARDAMLYQMQQGNVDVAKKKVVKVPKVMKPGKAATKTDAVFEKAQANLKRLKKTGSKRDAAAVIRDML
ncbi:MAG: hypothetical protein JAY60_18480 [Candidatus Thiodiazotropha weberae]|nr:hypothetical protein [Candidatus Thiodiazotropha weberae]